MTTRIYLVTEQAARYLVEATSQTQAVATVAKSRFNVRIATTKEVASLIRAGNQIIVAGETSEQNASQPFTDTNGLNPSVDC